jgi:hypothetical protein
MPRTLFEGRGLSEEHLAALSTSPTPGSPSPPGEGEPPAEVQSFSTNLKDLWDEVSDLADADYTEMDM